jgi:hypothetical protein
MGVSAECGGLVNFRGAIFRDGARLNPSDVHLEPGSHLLLKIES